MKEERLQEIKDSINFQYELIVSKGIDKSALLFTDEEQELLEEVERLHSIIKEVREYIEEWQRFPHTNGSTHKELKNLIDILDRESK